MLLTLPNEMILEIGRHLTHPTDIFSLIMTSRHMAIMMQPFLDKVSKNIQDVASEKQIPLIHYATANRHRMGVKLALKLDPASLHKFIPTQRTPLHAAVTTGMKSMVKLLLDHGADPNADSPQNTSGVSPDTTLNWALRGVSLNQIFNTITNQSEGIVMLLLRHGANPNALDRNNENALLQAASIRVPHILEAILNTGLVDINSCNEFGETALHVAAASGEQDSFEMVKLLVSHGVDLNALNNDGQTAIFDCWSPHSTALLIKCGLDIGIVDYSNRTVLHYLADFVYVGRSAELVDAILSSDGTIDIDWRDETQQTALDYAKGRKNLEVIKLLERYQ